MRSISRCLGDDDRSGNVIKEEADEDFESFCNAKSLICCCLIAKAAFAASLLASRAWTSNASFSFAAASDNDEDAEDEWGDAEEEEEVFEG